MKRESKPSSHSKTNHFKNVTFGIGLTILVITAFFLSCKDEESDKKPPDMPTFADQVKKRLMGLEKEIQDKENEKLKLIAQYEVITGKKLPIADILNIGIEERKVLEEYINKEKIISIKILLETLVKKNDEIRELQEKQKTLNGQHKPHVVKQGENHYQIANKYLLYDRNLEKEEVRKLLDKALFFDTLTPGFKIWNFYDGNEYSSFVTQGEAPISPAELERRKKDEYNKILEEERKKFQEKAAEIEKKARELKDAQREKQKELDATREKNRLISAENKQMEQQLNSLYYLVDTEKNLKKSGIISGGFLRSKKLKTIPGDLKNSIDLRENKTIKVNAGLLGLEKIKKVKVFPEHINIINGLHYQINIGQDKQEAAIVILKEENFKNHLLVISVK
jgi:hypothetical protein